MSNQTLISRIDAAIERITSGQTCMRVPAENSDPDLVLADCKRALLATAETPRAAGSLTLRVHLDTKAAREECNALLAELKQASAEQDIRAERARQDAQWGGAAHDDEHSATDFARYIERQLGRVFVAEAVATNQVVAATAHDVRARFVKAAALALAAIESIDRKKGAAA